jgi:hypothetical protein
MDLSLVNTTRRMRAEVPGGGTKAKRREQVGKEENRKDVSDRCISSRGGKEDLGNVE